MLIKFIVGHCIWSSVHTCINRHHQQNLVQFLNKKHPHFNLSLVHRPALRHHHCHHSIKILQSQQRFYFPPFIIRQFWSSYYCAIQINRKVRRLQKLTPKILFSVNVLCHCRILWNLCCKITSRQKYFCCLCISTLLPIHSVENQNLIYRRGVHLQKNGNLSRILHLWILVLQKSNLPWHSQSHQNPLKRRYQLLNWVKNLQRINDEHQKRRDRLRFSDGRFHWYKRSQFQAGEYFETKLIDLCTDFLGIDYLVRAEPARQMSSDTVFPSKKNVLLQHFIKDPHQQDLTKTFGTLANRTRQMHHSQLLRIHLKWQIPQLTPEIFAQLHRLVVVHKGQGGDLQKDQRVGVKSNQSTAEDSSMLPKSQGEVHQNEFALWKLFVLRRKKYRTGQRDHGKPLLLPGKGTKPRVR